MLMVKRRKSKSYRNFNANWIRSQGKSSLGLNKVKDVFFVRYSSYVVVNGLKRGDVVGYSARQVT